MKDENTEKDALPKVAKQPSKDRPLSDKEADEVSGGLSTIDGGTMGGGTGTTGDNTIPM